MAGGRNRLACWYLGSLRHAAMKAPIGRRFHPGRLRVTGNPAVSGGLRRRFSSSDVDHSQFAGATPGPAQQSSLNDLPRFRRGFFCPDAPPPATSFPERG
jgi:hypothetical protein